MDNRQEAGSQTHDSAADNHQNSDGIDPNSTSEDTLGGDAGARLARLVIEDYVVTSLLRTGKGLRSDELASGNIGFTLSRGAMREGLENSSRVYAADREWQLSLRTRQKDLSREERARQPLETALEALLIEIGKPLPLPVLVRELALQRSVYPETVRDAARNVLRSARRAIEVSDSTWLHASFTLDAGAPSEELILRENALLDDPDFAELHEQALTISGASLADRAATVLQAVGRPISQKLLGFLLWRDNSATFDRQALARALADRARFYNFIDGYTTLQSLVPHIHEEVQNWLRQLSGGGVEQVDVAALLRQRVAGADVLAPRPEDIADVKRYAEATDGRPFSVVNIITDIFEMESNDPQFVPAVQGLNDALRRDPEFLSAGIGRYLLREAVPSYVGEVPDELRPIHLSVRDPETDEPRDFEMSDEGLEGDAADFVHDPFWEDVNEEVEARSTRRSTEVPDTSRYIILSHHHLSGTMKLRRIDEEFFALEGPLAPLDIVAQDQNGSEQLTVWASRESGLLYGLGEWYIPRTPESGGVLQFARQASPSGMLRFSVTLGEPDKLTRIEGNRATELEEMRESSAYLSLFELLQGMMGEHQQGMELPMLWAEVNMVRRTTKRLMCSVLSAYHCFYFKQRGPKQILWRYDAGKLDQGFKRNKRKYVRR